MTRQIPTLPMPNVTLRPFIESDIDESYLSWFADEEVIKHLYVRHIAQDVERIKVSARGKIDAPNSYFFCIVVDAEKKIGTISLNKDPFDDVASYGYLIGSRSHWGGPYAIEAQAALFDFGFRTLGLRRIWADALSTNVPSLFNFHRLGFTREGVRRQAAVDGNGEAVDAIEYGLLADEWDHRRTRFFESE